jgi:DNA adenine methylase
MKPTPTPLRYPGGKAWLRNYVESFIHFNKLEVDTLIEPYAGSAAISIGLLQGGIVKQAYLSETDPLIVAFWKAALEMTN